MNLYVYYRAKGLDTDAEQRLRTCIDAIFLHVRQCTGIQGRCMRRRDDPSTWMEVYEDIDDIAALQTALDHAVRDHGLAAMITGRVAEVFQCA